MRRKPPLDFVFLVALAGQHTIKVGSKRCGRGPGTGALHEEVAIAAVRPRQRRSSKSNEGRSIAVGRPHKVDGSWTVMRGMAKIIPGLRPPAPGDRGFCCC